MSLLGNMRPSVGHGVQREWRTPDWAAFVEEVEVVLAFAKRS
jgi:hypothetical protein